MQNSRYFLNGPRMLRNRRRCHVYHLSIRKSSILEKQDHGGWQYSIKLLDVVGMAGIPKPWPSWPKCIKWVFFLHTIRFSLELLGGQCWTLYCLAYLIALVKASVFNISFILMTWSCQCFVLLWYISYRWRFIFFNADNSHLGQIRRKDEARPKNIRLLLHRQSQRRSKFRRHGVLV